MIPLYRWIIAPVGVCRANPIVRKRVGLPNDVQPPQIEPGFAQQDRVASPIRGLVSHGCPWLAEVPLHAGPEQQPAHHERKIAQPFRPGAVVRPVNVLRLPFVAGDLPEYMLSRMAAIPAPTTVPRRVRVDSSRRCMGLFGSSDRIRRGKSSPHVTGGEVSCPSARNTNGTRNPTCG